MGDSDLWVLQLRYKRGALQTDGKGYPIGLYVEKGRFFSIILLEPTAMSSPSLPPSYATEADPVSTSLVNSVQFLTFHEGKDLLFSNFLFSRVHRWHSGRSSSNNIKINARYVQHSST